MVEEVPAAAAVGMVLPGEGGILMIGVGALEESLEEVRTEGALEEEQALESHLGDHHNQLSEREYKLFQIFKGRKEEEMRKKGTGT